MKTLERDTATVDGLIQVMPFSTVRGLARSLRQLTLEQQLFVRRTLLDARANGRWPEQQLDLLEYLFDRWYAHGLATKLVVISYVTRLSDGEPWPGEAVPELLSVGRVA